jgi:flagellin-like hook-associated protein FlgL
VPITINTNVASLNAQRRLGQSTQALQQSFERLSSGLRINKASDDAAGLAIASSLNVDSRVFTTATRNANDAVSFFSIAEGALTSLVDITTRLKELAQESSNGTLSYTQRKSLDAEAQALGKEYQRIINTTQFNGTNIINSGNGPLAIQAGYSPLSLSGGNAPTGTFIAPTTNAVGLNPQSVTTADFNGDGVTDLVSANRNSLTVSVLLGNGDGTFSAQQTFATAGDQPTFVLNGDFNGDGIADLAYGTATSHIGVLLGNGNGTFKVAQTYATGAQPRAIAIADVNGDGRLDLISADSASGQINVLLGNGDGTFTASQTYANFLGPHSVTSADVNGDGIADLISADYFIGGGQLSVFIGNGNGSFRAAAIYDNENKPASVKSEDLNGDSILDLYTADGSSNLLSVYFGNGDGTFRAAQTYQSGSNPKFVTSSDVNGDGLVDLISGDYGGSLSVLFGNGNGTFRANVSYPTGNLSASIAATDLNGDGAVDLVSVDSSGNSLSVFLGNGSAQAVVAPTTGTFSLLSQQSSRQALTQFGQVLNRLTASLGQVGANESRLQTVNNVLQQARENYTSAASQILDVDVASEAANLTKGNILQQAGAAILSQANQQPTLALQLLRNL